jgi:hypothetical protein
MKIRFSCPVEKTRVSGAPPTEVGGTNAPASAKPAEVPFPHLSAFILADESARWSWWLSAKAGKKTRYGTSLEAFKPRL